LIVQTDGTAWPNDPLGRYGLEEVPGLDTFRPQVEVLGPLSLVDRRQTERRGRFVDRLVVQLLLLLIDDPPQGRIARDLR
jgi:hypothetical protein